MTTSPMRSPAFWSVLDLDRRQLLIELRDVVCRRRPAPFGPPPLQRPLDLPLFVFVAAESCKRGGSVRWTILVEGPPALHSQRRGATAVAGFLHRHGDAARRSAATPSSARSSGNLRAGKILHPLFPVGPAPSMPASISAGAAGLVRRRGPLSPLPWDCGPGAGQVPRRGRRQDEDLETIGAALSFKAGRCGLRWRFVAAFHSGDLA